MTTDCLFILNTLIEKARVDKSSLFVCFVDFHKAFDSVHHGALWSGSYHTLVHVLQGFFTSEVVPT